MTENLEMSIYELDIATRTFNALIRRRMYTVNDIINIASCNELMGIRHFGDKSFDDLISCMRKVGFSAWADRMEAGKRTTQNF